MATKKQPAKQQPASKAEKKKAAAKARPAATGGTAKPGDLIVIDSSKVGSPPREGEVLEVVQGQVSVSYRVRWPDGHQSLIAPGAGITHIVPSQRKR
jgi:hypothetical protein